MQNILKLENKVRRLSLMDAIILNDEMVQASPLSFEETWHRHERKQYIMPVMDIRETDQPTGNIDFG